QMTPDAEQPTAEDDQARAEDAAGAQSPDGCERCVCPGCPAEEDTVAAAEAPEMPESHGMPEVPAARTGPRGDGPLLELGVTFPHNSKVYSFSSGGLRLSIGDKVLVRTDKGVDLGDVVRIKGKLTPERAEELTEVVRAATREDLEHVAEQDQRERRALEICEEKVAEHKLPMKLIGAHMSFDNTRLVFLFSAEGRVDFRELVRDLAGTFHMRIELRQVGVRDEAKLLGGLGPCGRALCCKTFMRNFEPVGIRIAKDQGLALNPNKLSGLCDRLMCCLRFEHETYLHLRDQLPPKGTRVQVPDGVGEVRDVNVLKEELVVRVAEGREVTVPLAEARVLAEGEEPQFVAPAAEPDRAPPPPRPEFRRRAEPAPEAEVAVEEKPADQETPEQQKEQSEKQESRRGRRRPRSRRKQDRAAQQAAGGQSAGGQSAGGQSAGGQSATAAPSGDKPGSAKSDAADGQRRSRRSRGRGGRRRSKRPGSGSGGGQT
ncbi:MAG TPA: stage 0 sporulation family protein, partial [Armatimonadota bacterium]|nr:stage 0 sporulation family protein [Armatimonadota bacterium]